MVELLSNEIKDHSLNNCNKQNSSNEEIDTLATFGHPNKENWCLAFKYMLKIADFDLADKEIKVKYLIRPAQYNVGKAYFQGFGVKQSDRSAEKYWLLAANDGSSDGCVQAM
jgi:hypothetical protein